MQASLSFNSCTAFDVINTTTTVINNTGYFRVFGANNLDKQATGSVDQFIAFSINDGATDKQIYKIDHDYSNATNASIVPFDFIVFLEAGHSFKIQATSNFSRSAGATRQLASIDGVLVNP